MLVVKPRVLAVACKLQVVGAWGPHPLVSTGRRAQISSYTWYWGPRSNFKFAI